MRRPCSTMGDLANGPSWGPLPNRRCGLVDLGWEDGPSEPAMEPATSCFDSVASVGGGWPRAVGLLVITGGRSGTGSRCTSKAGSDSS